MALSLSAEQKNVKSIFLNEDKYIIPSFQRPYSWEYEQCLQLYNDLNSAYQEDRDYFVGNIILAKGDNSPSKLHLVDGQQRLITLWLILKVLYILYPEMRILGKLVSIESWEGENSEKKISSEIFENDDDGSLQKIHHAQMLETWVNAYINKGGAVNENKCNDRIIANYLWLYIWFNNYKQRNAENCKNFIKFFLERVYLLPIELTGSTIDDACGKALTIFETINNRGMNLTDADIFKARLYNKAALIQQSDDFIQRWIEFKAECDRQGYEIDEIFRFYSHIIRGKEGISGSEKNLRDFFLTEDFSPLHRSYVEVMDSLMKILELLDYLSEMTVSNSKVTPWLQVLEAYTNQYPKYAVLNYLYVNGYDNENEENFIHFLQQLIRYVYSMGSTTTVKFDIYSVIKRTSCHEEITFPIKPIVEWELITSGRLRIGFALLAHYLQNKTTLPKYTVDRLVKRVDWDSLSGRPQEELYESIANQQGNLLIVPKLKRGTLAARLFAYKVDSVISYDYILERNKKQLDVLKNFMTKYGQN